MADEGSPEGPSGEPKIEGGFYLCGPEGPLSDSEREATAEYIEVLNQRAGAQATGEAVDSEEK